MHVKLSEAASRLKLTNTALELLPLLLKSTPNALSCPFEDVLVDMDLLAAKECELLLGTTVIL